MVVGSEILDAKNFSFKGGEIKIVCLDLVDTAKADWLDATREKMQAVLDEYLNAK